MWATTFHIPKLDALDPQPRHRTQALERKPYTLRQHFSPTDPELQSNSRYATFARPGTKKNPAPPNPSTLNPET